MAEDTNPAWEEQKKTWHNFIGITKWAIVGLAILVVFLYIVVHP